MAIIGAGDADPATRECAREVGRLVAEAGAVLLCGGRGGVMEAAAEGAAAAGGLTVGILPGEDERTSPPNPHIRLPIFTGLGQARNLVLVLSADALIAIGGEWGTLSEIALAMKHRKPLVLLDSWRLDPPGAPGTPMPATASSPAEAVRPALELLGATR